MTNKNIKLIIFDGYGVIFNGGFPQTCTKLSQLFKRNKAELYKIIYTKYFNQAATKKISQQQAWGKAIKELDLPISVDEIKKIHYSFMNINRAVLSLAKEAKQNYKIILLTKNTRPQLRDALLLMPEVREVFEKNIINTWEYNLAKASQKTIQMIANKYRVKLTEVVYIDDQAENLKSAKNLGVTTILYSTFPDFKKKLLNHCPPKALPL